MATDNLSSYDPASIEDAGDLRFGIVVSDWNSEVTYALLNGAISTLMQHGVKEEEILVKHVPGSFELPLAAQWVAEYDDVDGIICLGCVIQGETPHFTYVCQGVTAGIAKLNLEYNIPVIFGLLTTDTQQQAVDRAGGKHGNKGTEAAVTALRMAFLQREMED
ncbi:MAG: 6,7-dimethyl-8-ribityllumazine synthase [Bacteroidales bacterium]|nr:6,7-dimethyl-8-ribityllumazine synthase [Bacteroidales bacterium]MCA1756411.1 6,7-dimethyl-8-ribityllumazine synthase [Bacteroidales bacterium]